MFLSTPRGWLWSTVAVGEADLFHPQVLGDGLQLVDEDLVVAGLAHIEGVEPLQGLDEPAGEIEDGEGIRDQGLGKAHLIQVLEHCAQSVLFHRKHRLP